MAGAKRILWADFARGLAALGVLAHHVDVPGTKQFYVFVDFFFVLSGFVLAKSLDSIQDRGDWRQFALKRLFRFMPLVWLAIATKVSLTFIGTLIGKPCEPYECEPALILSAALLLQVFVPATFMVLGPLWSLSVELFVNFGYAAKLPISRKTTTFAGIGIGLVLTIASYFVPRYGPNLFDNFHGFARGVFAFGCGLAITYLPKLAKPIWLILASALASVFVLKVDLGEFQPLVAAVVFTALVWSLSCLMRETDNRFYVFVATLFGNASFGIYVWHGAIRGTVQKLASLVGLDAGSVGYWSFNFVVLSVISICIALATFHWIEMPIMGWFRKKVNVRLAK